MGVIFAKKTKARKTRKLPPRENFHVYSTLCALQHSFLQVEQNDAPSSNRDTYRRVPSYGEPTLTVTDTSCIEKQSMFNQDTSLESLEETVKEQVYRQPHIRNTPAETQIRCTPLVTNVRNRERKALKTKPFGDPFTHTSFRKYHFSPKLGIAAKSNIGTEDSEEFITSGARDKDLLDIVEEDTYSLNCLEEVSNSQNNCVEGVVNSSNCIEGVADSQNNIEGIDSQNNIERVAEDVDMLCELEGAENANEGHSLIGYNDSPVISGDYQVDSAETGGKNNSKWGKFIEEENDDDIDALLNCSFGFGVPDSHQMPRDFEKRSTFPLRTIDNNYPDPPTFRPDSVNPKIHTMQQQGVENNVDLVFQSNKIGPYGQRLPQNANQMSNINMFENAQSAMNAYENSPRGMNMYENSPSGMNMNENSQRRMNMYENSPSRTNMYQNSTTRKSSLTNSPANRSPNFHYKPDHKRNSLDQVRNIGASDSNQKQSENSHNTQHALSTDSQITGLQHDSPMSDDPPWIREHAEKLRSREFKSPMDSSVKTSNILIGSKVNYISYCILIKCLFFS